MFFIDFIIITCLKLHTHTYTHVLDPFPFVPFPWLFFRFSRLGETLIRRQRLLGKPRWRRTFCETCWWQSNPKSSKQQLMFSIYKFLQLFLMFYRFRFISSTTINHESMVHVFFLFCTHVSLNVVIWCSGTRDIRWLYLVQVVPGQPWRLGQIDSLFVEASNQ